jgi:hypothetical protein
MDQTRTVGRDPKHKAGEHAPPARKPAAPAAKPQPHAQAHAHAHAARPGKKRKSGSLVQAGMVRVLTFGVIAVFGIVAVLFLRDMGTASGVNWFGGN